jgi:O-antigen/teichoic acid export membrane protein
MILICGVLLWGHVTVGAFKIEWFVYSQTAAYLATVGIALLIVMRKAKFSRLKWNKPFFLMIIKKSFPFAILGLLMAFYNRIDSVMVERILPGNTGEYQAGLYASAYRLLDASNMIAYLFSVLLLPLFARMLKFKESVEKLARLSFTLLFVLSVISAMGSFFYSEQFMTMLYPQHIEESAAVFASRISQTSEIFGLLMFGFIPISSVYVFGTLLTANGNLKQLNIIAGCGMLLNISLNFLLIPWFQAIGSAYASLTTQLITAGLQIVLVVHLFKFKLNIGYLVRVGLFLAATLTFSALSCMLPYSWMINMMLMVLCSLIFAASVGLLSVKSLIYALKKS